MYVLRPLLLYTNLLFVCYFTLHVYADFRLLHRAAKPLQMATRQTTERVTSPVIHMGGSVLSRLMLTWPRGTTSIILYSFKSFAEIKYRLIVFKDIMQKCLKRKS